MAPAVCGRPIPTLRAAYVHQWNFGIEREILKNTALEIRYVGNYAPNTWRAYNINEVNIFENGFLQEYSRMRRVNFAAFAAVQALRRTGWLRLCYLSASYRIFDKFFTAVQSHNGYTNAAFLNQLDR